MPRLNRSEARAVRVESEERNPAIERLAQTIKDNKVRATEGRAPHAMPCTDTTCDWHYEQPG